MVEKVVVMVVDDVVGLPKVVCDLVLILVCFCEVHLVRCGALMFNVY